MSDSVSSQISLFWPPSAAKLDWRRGRLAVSEGERYSSGNVSSVGVLRIRRGEKTLLRRSGIRLPQASQRSEFSRGEVCSQRQAPGGIPCGVIISELSRRMGKAGVEATTAVRTVSGRYGFGLRGYGRLGIYVGSTVTGVPIWVLPVRKSSE